MNNKNIDEVCDSLRALVRSGAVKDLDRVEVHIRADGRVEFYMQEYRGFNLDIIHADVAQGSALPTPAAALAKYLEKKAIT